MDRLSGTEFLARAHVVVNATGPWSDEVRQDGQQLLRCTKGAHVVVPRTRLGLTHAVTLLSPMDGRVMFALPWGDLSYIGTTETDVDGSPDTIAATAEDVVYLLRSANAVFPDARLHPDDVVATWAGVRPLARPPDTRGAGAVSREHVITERAGMISVVGGKLTTYRRMAADVVDRVSRALHELDGRPEPPRAATDREPLPGGETAELDAIGLEMEREGLASPVAQHLVRRYGTEAPAVARLAASDPLLARPIAPGGVRLRAELVHAGEREMALTLCDLLVRRTHAFYEIPGHAVDQADELAALVAPRMGWDAARTAAEAEAYRAHVAHEEAFRLHLP